MLKSILLESFGVFIRLKTSTKKFKNWVDRIDSAWYTNQRRRERARFVRSKRRERSLKTIQNREKKRKRKEKTVNSEKSFESCVSRCKPEHQEEIKD